MSEEKQKTEIFVEMESRRGRGEFYAAKRKGKKGQKVNVCMAKTRRGLLDKLNQKFGYENYSII